MLGGWQRAQPSVGIRHSGLQVLTRFVLSAVKQMLNHRAKFVARKEMAPKFGGARVMARVVLDSVLRFHFTSLSG